jgi:hypothetical protein
MANSSTAPHSLAVSAVIPTTTARPNDATAARATINQARPERASMNSSSSLARDWLSAVIKLFPP